MKKFILSLLFLSSLTANAQSVPSPKDQGDQQLNSIKQNVARSVKSGEVKVLLEKMYKASSRTYKTEIEFEEGENYEILVVMSGGKGEISSVLYDKKGIDSSEYRSKQFEEEGLLYSGHSILYPNENQTFTLNVSAKDAAKDAQIYLAIVEYIEEENVEKRSSNSWQDYADKQYERSLIQYGFIKAYSRKDFMIHKASELPIYLEMEVHEGNDYSVIASFFDSDAVAHVVLLDPDRGNVQSKVDNTYDIPSVELRTVHKGVKTYFIKVDKLKGTLEGNEKVYIYTAYRTLTNIKSDAVAGDNLPEDYFTK